MRLFYPFQCGTQIILASLSIHTPPRNHAAEEKGIPMIATYKDQGILEKRRGRISLAKTAV